jgi:hypothetical protein
VAWPGRDVAAGKARKDWSTVFAWVRFPRTNCGGAGKAGQGSARLGKAGKVFPNSESECKMETARFVKSNDTAILEAVLRDVQEGELITYAALTAAIGRDVRKFAKGCLSSARNILERDGVHCACVAGEGIKRLAPGECVDKARSQIVRARRSARRGRTTIETTDFSRLSEDEKQSAVAIVAQSGAIELFGAKKAEKRLAQAATNTNEGIPLGKTLELFTK